MIISMETETEREREREREKSVCTQLQELKGKRRKEVADHQ